MNAAPTLFGRVPAVAPEAGTERHAGTLADLLYDGLYMIFLLRNGKAPASAPDFNERIEQFLGEFERAAKRRDFAPDDVFDAKYAFCAAVDETILSSTLAIREAWERRPLQLALFGDQLAGELFFDRLETCRNAGARRLPALEVFHMCLLLGFKGKYLLEGPEKLAYLTAQLGEQIAHIKGRRAPFAPHWMIPDSISHTLRRVLPVWVASAVLALCGLLAFLALKTYADHQTRQALAPYNEIVKLAPRAPHITLTLP